MEGKGTWTLQQSLAEALLLFVLVGRCFPLEVVKSGTSSLSVRTAGRSGWHVRTPRSLWHTQFGTKLDVFSLAELDSCCSHVTPAQIRGGASRDISKGPIPVISLQINPFVPSDCWSCPILKEDVPFVSCPAHAHTRDDPEGAFGAGKMDLCSCPQ